MYRILFFALFLAGTVQAQERPAQQGKSNSGMNRDSLLKNMPAVCKVIGTLKDSVSKEAMEFASVALIRVRDTSAVGGNLTDEKGHFNIAEVQPGRYKLRISSIGYKSFDTQSFTLTMQDPLKDFGVVNVSPTLRALKEVNITEEKQEYTNTLDKKIFNVDKNLITTGGSVSDVLQNVPSVTVDIDGAVSLRGSENVTVLIDGKPSGLTAENRAAILRQIPASSIDQVEVITNPGARYDAEGMSGIINIKTKKDKRKGVNGTITAGAGTRDKYNASLNLNKRTQKFNVYGNYGFRRDDRKYRGYSDRANLYDFTFINADNFGLQRNISHTIKSGFDWFVNDYNTLGVTAGLNLRNEKNKDNNTTEILFANNPLVDSGYQRISNSPEDGSTIDGSLDYRKTFAGNKRELSTSVNASQSKRNTTDTYSTYPMAGPAISDQRQLNDRTNFNYGGQLDYIHPTQKIRYETGAKVTVRDNETSQHLDRYNSDNSNWSRDSAFSNIFNYLDEVYAGYVQAGGKIGIIEAQVGLRSEYTRMVGDSPDTSFSRDFIDLFPSATIRYNLKKDQDIQLAYSRRINRPDNRQLNPFTNYSDSLNLQRGNPGINPEYVHSLELGYIARIKEQSFSFTLYYRYIQDYLQRYRTIDPFSRVTLTTFKNFSSAQNSGIEVVLRNQLKKGVTLNTTFNGYYNKVDASNVEAALTSEAFVWDIRASLNAKVLKSTSFQVTANYMAPRVGPQGTFRGMQGVDVGIRQEFKGGKWSLNLAVSDIFNQRKFQIENTTPLFTLNSTRKRESRVATLTLSYSFGSTDGNPFTRKKQNRNSDQPSNEMPDF